MGMFQQFKQLRETTAAMPAMMNQVGALRAATQGHVAAGAPVAAAMSLDDPRLVAIDGIDLPTYAKVVKTSVVTGLAAGAVAAELGLDPASWQGAAAGWPARMSGDLALAVHYGNLYARVA